MKCLENIIGLRGICDEGNHLCYINDEIPLKMFSKLANDEDVSGKGLFQRLRRMAAESVSADFEESLDGYQFNDIIKSEIKGSWGNKATIYEGVADISVMKNCSDPYLSNQVVSLSFKSLENYSQVVFTIVKGTETETITQDVVKGINTFDIDYNGDNFSFSFDQNLKLCKTDSGCNCSSNCYCGSCYTVTDKLRVFQICVNCICSAEALICKYRMSLKSAMIQRLAAFFWEEFQKTCRKNPVAQGLEENAEYSYSKIMGGRNRHGDRIEKKDSKYYPRIWAAARKIKGSLKTSKCVSCRGFRYVETI